MIGPRCARRRPSRRAGTRHDTLIRALPALAGTVLLAAATAGQPEPQVEFVDDSAYPEVRVVVSAPQPDVQRSDTTFLVSGNDGALPVEAATVPPRAVELVLLVTAPDPQVEVTDVRSAVMDIVLRLPPATRVAIVSTAPRPEVLARLGGSLQDRVLAASRIAAGEPVRREAFTLALEQLSHVEDHVRSIAVVGASGPDVPVPADMSGLLAQRQVTVHAVPLEPGAGEGLLARLSSLYRLAFEVDEGTREVTLRFDGEAPSSPVTVRLPAAPAGGSPAAATPAPAVDGAETSATLDGGSIWERVLLMLAAVGVMLLSASIAMPIARAGERGEPSAGPWEQAAAQAASRTGATAEASDAAARILRERRESAAAIWSAGRETRWAATVLAVQPLVIGAVVLLTGSDALPGAVAGAWHPTVLGALVLAVVGALWLHRVARPPFSPWPPRWRSHEREVDARRATVDTLDRARLHAAGGLSLDESLARAGAGREEHPARRSVDSGDAAAEGASAADRLAIASHALRAEEVAAARQHARHGIAAAAVPFVVCILPAAILLFAGRLAAFGG